MHTSNLVTASAPVHAHQHATPHGGLPGADVVEVSVIATRDTPHSGVVPTALTLAHLSELLDRADHLGIPRDAVVLFEDTGPSVYRGRVRVTGAGVRAMVGETALRPPTGRTRSADLPCTCGHRQDSHIIPDAGLAKTCESCGCRVFALDGARAAAQDRETTEAYDRRMRRAARAESWSEGVLAGGGNPANLVNPYLGDRTLGDPTVPVLADDAVCEGCRHEYAEHDIFGPGNCTRAVEGNVPCTCRAFLAGGG